MDNRRSESEMMETYFVYLCCAVSDEQGQDEFIYTQKHPGSPCSTQTADGVQGC